MHPIAREDRIHVIAVACATEVSTRALERKALPGRCRLMTLAAHHLRDRRMNFLVEHPALIGSVWIVTAGATRGGDAIARVFFQKNWLVWFVASDTQCWN